MPAAFTISVHRSPWVGMLRESETCAVFAAITPFCLQLDIPEFKTGQILVSSRCSVLLCEIYLSPPPREDTEIYQYGKHGKLMIKRDSTTRFYLGKWESDTIRVGNALRNTLSLSRLPLAYEYQLVLDSELLAPCLIGLWNVN